MPRPGCCPAIQTRACRRSPTRPAVGRSTVYRHFANREELFERGCGRCHRARHRRGRGDPRERRTGSRMRSARSASSASSRPPLPIPVLPPRGGEGGRDADDRRPWRAAVGFPQRGPGARRDPRRSADRLDRKGPARGDDRDDRRRARRSDRPRGCTDATRGTPWSRWRSRRDELRRAAPQRRRAQPPARPRDRDRAVEPRSAGERAGDRRCLRPRPDHDLPALPEPREPARGRHRRDHRHRPRGDHGRSRRSGPGDCDPRPRRRLDRPRAPLRAPVCGSGRTECGL